MQRSIASMDRIIAENEGKTFTALSKIKHDFDDEIIECKDEVKDLYSSISNYVSDMKGIIYAPSAGRMTLVDRNDIYLNMKAIKLACESIRGVGSSEYGSTLNTDNYEAGSDALNKILSDVNRTARMRAAIEASSKKIDNLYDKIETIYKTKIVKYENKDDAHASKMRRLHSKYTSQEEARREGDEASTDVVKGVIAWFKDLVLGAWDLVVLVGGIGTYGVCKIVGANPPDWSKNRVEGLKGVTPVTLIESICQSASDAAAEKGYAYGAGYIAVEAASMVIGAGLAKNAVKGTKLANKADDLADAAKGVDRLDDISDVTKGIKVGDTLEDGSKVVRISSAEEANRELTRGKYVKPPYDSNKPVYIVKTGGKEKFVRVYGGKSGQKGQWIMKHDDVKGLTPKQIQEKYALPAEPTKICDVNVPKGTELRTGTAAPVEGWGKGGGQQYDLQGQRLPNDAWVNERNIGGIVE